jgi:hypothetical protein
MRSDLVMLLLSCTHWEKRWSESRSQTANQQTAPFFVMFHTILIYIPPKRNPAPQARIWLKSIKGGEPGSREFHRRMLGV